TYGERPLSLAQVVDAGYLNSVPLDMSYDAVTGEVSCGTGAVGLTDGEAQTAVGFMIVVLIIMFVGYFIPTIVAVARGLPGIGGIVAINVLLGWSLIGWAVALAMALRSKPPTYRLATSGVGSPAVGYAPTAPGGAMSWAPPGGYPPPPPGAGYAAPAGGYPPPPPPADGYGPPAGWAPPVGPNDRTF
ncbi:MAG TPA: superinfection immunity protein, partial [Aquihabitans sp.]|nr:superinfection immunity protein [Aquihabitans sp.]